MGRSNASRELGSPALAQLFDDLLPMARRSRIRSDAATNRFVTRQEPGRFHPFTERWRWVILGHVQGVGFRSSCSRRAIDLGLKGWVRNLRDGSVEVQAEGGPLALSELRAWCEKGPPGARVQCVKPSQLPVTGNDWFEIRY
jgi:acylphosphatase